LDKEKLEKMLVKLHIRSTQTRHLTRGWFCSLVTNEGSGRSFCTVRKLVGLIRCKNEKFVMNVVFDNSDVDAVADYKANEALKVKKKNVTS